MRPHKYHARPTVVNGFRFASQREAARYQELILRGLAGEICNLELQPRFAITVDGERVADYVADFRYDERVTGYVEPRFRRGECIEIGGIHYSWRDVVEDVKGMKTPLYRLKKKLVERQHKITIREVR